MASNYPERPGPSDGNAMKRGSDRWE
jgi:hypothetical protein